MPGKQKKNKKKKAKKKQSNLSKALSVPNRPKNVIWSYFENLSPYEICINVDKIDNHPYFSPLVKLSSLSGYKDFYQLMSPSTSLEISLNWMVGLIIYHKESLSQFIELESMLTKSILEGKYDKSTTLLDKIDAKCGVSTWSVALRGAILKLADKYEDAQEFLNTIYSTNDNQFSKTICRYLINRYDENSSMFASTSDVLRRDIIRNMPGDLQNFLMYKIVPLDFSFDYDINYAYVLNYEKRTSIIDIFKAMINFLSSAINSEDSSIQIFIRRVVEKLSPNFSGYIIDGFSNHYGIGGSWTHNKLDYELIDLYSAGKYEAICEKARENPNDYFSFSTFEIIAKAATRADKNPFLGFRGEILADLIKVLLKEEKYLESLCNLFVICHAFSGIPWFQELHFLISRESDFIDKKTHRHLMMLTSIFSEVNSPKKMFIFPKELQGQYIQSCNKTINDSLSIKLFEAIKDKNIDAFNNSVFKKIEKNRLLKYKIQLLIEERLVLKAIPLLERLCKCNDQIMVYEATKLLVESYLDTGQENKAIKLFVKAVLKNINVIQVFDTNRICKIAQKMINESNIIYLPIALSLHSRFISSNFDSTLRYSFEKYLNNINLKSPLELINIMDEVGKQNVFYFLEHVCTQNIMKLSFLFEDKTEIENCRIAVCTYLIEVDVSKEIMINEVKEIIKEQTIRKAVTQVDQSRIHADLGGFKDNRSQAFRNIYGRYLELKKIDYSSYDDEKTLNTMYETFSKELILEGGHAIYVYDLTYNEKNTTFHRLISMLRNEFTFGEKGLNNYLSTRIRHGVLPGKIRPCASKEYLITVIQANTGEPKSNEYWRNTFPLIPDFEWTQLEKALSKFTKDFEITIAEINDEWLQIVSLDQDIQNLKAGGSKSKALFNYSTSMVETYGLQRSLVEDDYEDFAKLVSGWLWARTETNLRGVQEEIKTTAKDKFTSIYSKLSESINTILENKSLVTTFNDAISRSKVELDSTLNFIATWFTRSETDMIKEFEISTAIEIAARCANVDVNNNTLKNNIVFFGKHLNSFVDILYILFENAVTKSSISKENLGIDISLNLDSNGDLILEVKNNCTITTSVEIANKNLDRYREACEDERLISSKAIQGEGGTGLLKICNIMSKDIGIEHDIDFGYRADNTFVIIIIMKKINGVIKNENTTS